MPKRRHSSSLEAIPPPALKTPRIYHAQDYLSPLSDELLIRILHHLPLLTLLQCELLSHRFRRLSVDSHLWKSLYYTRFVLPCALRIPGIKSASDKAEGALLFSSRRSKWLDGSTLVESGLDRKGKQMNWKARYRLRHNWSSGACEVGELLIGDGRDGLVEEKDKRMLVGLAEGMVITADKQEGIRIWDLKAKSLLAKSGLKKEDTPSCLAVDEQYVSEGGLGVAVGFIDGSWGVWRLEIKERALVQVYRRTAAKGDSGIGSLSAIAYSSPYVLTISDAQLMSLYTFDKPPIHPSSDQSHNNDQLEVVEPGVAPKSSPSSDQEKHPHLLTSLKSRTTWPPLSLSIRMTSNTLIASIAYTLPTYLSGFTIGLQELRFSLLPSPSFPLLTSSRLTSAEAQGFHAFSPVSLSPSSSPTRPSPSSSTRPTSLSYSHPYILATHPDNTLTLYLCTSTAEHLSISKGTKLWGHTSGVSSAEITSRGKAVSVSAKGEELRVWELEGGREMSRRKGEEGCVVVRSGMDAEVSIVAEELQEAEVSEVLEARRGWLGFDDEVVIVLRVGVRGPRALMIYDFT